MKSSSVVIAIAMVAVYVFIPAYRYYAIGSYIGYKILSDKSSKYRVVKKGSNLLKG